jgi:hypothetical protein
MFYYKSGNSLLRNPTRNSWHWTESSQPSEYNLATEHHPEPDSNLNLFLKVKVKLSLPWRHMGSILDLGTRWRWVVSFTPQPLYPREKSPRIHIIILRSQVRSCGICGGQSATRALVSIASSHYTNCYTLIHPIIRHYIVSIQTVSLNNQLKNIIYPSAPTSPQYTLTMKFSVCTSCKAPRDYIISINRL